MFAGVRLLSFSHLKLLYRTDARASAPEPYIASTDCVPRKRQPSNLLEPLIKHPPGLSAVMRELVAETIAQLPPDAQARYARVKARRLAASTLHSTE
jgi:hypothetical protein